MTLKEGDSQHQPLPSFLQSSWAAAGDWAAFNPVPPRAAHPGHLRSCLPAPSARDAPGPQSGTRKGYTDLRAPPAFAAPELFLYLISSHYGNLHTSAEYISVQNTNQEQ